MANDKFSQNPFLPLTPPVFHILLALADEERHGYGIMLDVASQTNRKPSVRTSSSG